MWTHSKHLTSLALALTVSLLGAACTSQDSAADFLYGNADPYRGGALWDTWWKVPEVKEGIAPGATATIDGVPVTSSLPADNPLYATNTAGSTRSGPDTWRCKECHGWDYKGRDGAYGSGSHATGFAGVLAASDRSVAALFDVIATGGALGSGHAFAPVLSPADIADMVKFIREGLVDDDLLIASNKASKGDAVAGKPLFDGSCANCHGADGKKLNFVLGQYASEYVFNLAHANPWELVHKVRFGQPNGEMPNGAVKGYVLEDVADILAYAQSLAPAGLEEASGSRGGVLWDAWWEVNGAAKPGTTNSLYATNPAGSTRTGADTWRCKECHGWDYKGRDGAYGTGSHRTGFPGVMAASARTVQQLIDMIGAGLPASGGAAVSGHAFEGSGLLSSADVKDLALFIKEEMVDDADSISYVTKRSKGSATAGAALFAGNCATCHGASGMRINFGMHDPVPATEYVGDLARDNPFELAHKIRFGQPGSDAAALELQAERGLVTGHMPSKFDAAYSETAVANIVAYCQGLPGSAERGGLVWDEWWEAPEVREAIEPGTTVTIDGVQVSSSLPADNPQYATHTGTSVRTGSQTWRCKECHGWDYKGKDGVYASGSHNTNFPGVLAAKGKPASELYASIFDGVLPGGTVPSHAFGAVLGDWVVRDVVNFIASAPDFWVELIDAPTKTVLPYDGLTMTLRTRDADGFLGGLKFAANCAGCHGSDGRAINFAEADGAEEYVGTIAKDNPWELANKILHGQPGSVPTMPTAAGKYYSFDDVADLIVYAQQLP